MFLQPNLFEVGRFFPVSSRIGFNGVAIDAFDPSTEVSSCIFPLITHALLDCDKDALSARVKMVNGKPAVAVNKLKQSIQYECKFFLAGNFSAFNPKNNM